MLLLEAVQAESCARLGPSVAVALRAGPCSVPCPRGPQGPLAVVLSGAATAGRPLAVVLKRREAAGRLLSAGLSLSRLNVVSRAAECLECCEGTRRELFPRVCVPRRLVLTSQKSDRRMEK